MTPPAHGEQSVTTRQDLDDELEPCRPTFHRLLDHASAEDRRRKSPVAYGVHAWCMPRRPSICIDAVSPMASATIAHQI